MLWTHFFREDVFPLGQFESSKLHLPGLLIIFLINRLIYTETLPHPKISVITRKIPLTSNALVEMDIYFQFALQTIHMVVFFFKAQESRLSQSLKPCQDWPKHPKFGPPRE